MREWLNKAKDAAGKAADLLERAGGRSPGDMHDMFLGQAGGWADLGRLYTELYYAEQLEDLEKASADLDYQVGFPGQDQAPDLDRLMRSGAHGQIVIPPPPHSPQYRPIRDNPQA